jgi:hypothetical protein
MTGASTENERSLRRDELVWPWALRHKPRSRLIFQKIVNMLDFESTYSHTRVIPKDVVSIRIHITDPLEGGAPVSEYQGLLELFHYRPDESHTQYQVRHHSCCRINLTLSRAFSAVLVCCDRLVVFFFCACLRWDPPVYCRSCSMRDIRAMVDFDVWCSFTDSACSLCIYIYMCVYAHVCVCVCVCVLYVCVCVCVHAHDCERTCVYSLFVVADALLVCAAAPDSRTSRVFRKSTQLRGTGGAQVHGALQRTGGTAGVGEDSVL